jgi:hypothetical protein
MSRDKQKNDKALGMKTQRVVDGSEQTIEFFKSWTQQSQNLLKRG